MKLLSMLSTIFFIALVLRTYNLENVPVGFHGDEASIGYNAYSILKTARDQNGNFLPLAIDQFGDFRPAGYHYIAVPFVALFGLSEFATRLPAAIFGSLTIFPMFFVLKELFKNQKTALLGSFLLTITPWHIATSRSSSESIIAIFLVLLGSLFFLRSFGKPINHRAILAALTLFAASFLFYHAARLFVPFLFAVLSFMLLNSIKLRKRQIMILAAYNGILLTVLLLVFTLGRGVDRPLAVSIFWSKNSLLQLAEQVRQDSEQNPIVTRFFHNKVLAYTYTFTNYYFGHLDGNFLFTKGGVPTRYIIPWTGNFHPIFLPFLIIGFSFLLVELIQSKKYLYGGILFWFLFGPVPAALTTEEIPNIQRSIMMLPAAIFIIAYGFAKSISMVQNRRFISIFVVVVSALLFHNFFSFAHNYFHHSFTHQPWYRNIGEKELVVTLADLQTQYDKIIATSANDNNIIFHLFYRKVEPSYYQSLGSPRDTDNLVFENITFLVDHCPLVFEDEPVEESVVFVNIGECEIPPQGKLLREIKRPDGTIAFRVIGIKPKSRM